MFISATRVTHWCTATAPSPAWHRCERQCFQRRYARGVRVRLYGAGDDDIERNRGGCKPFADTAGARRRFFRDVRPNGKGDVLQAISVARIDSAVLVYHADR